MSKLEIPPALKQFATNSWKSGFPITIAFSADASDSAIVRQMEKMIAELHSIGAITVAPTFDDVDAGLNSRRIKNLADHVVVLNPDGQLTDQQKKEITYALRLDLPTWSCHTGKRFKSSAPAPKHVELVV